MKDREKRANAPPRTRAELEEEVARLRRALAERHRELDALTHRAESASSDQDDKTRAGSIRHEAVDAEAEATHSGFASEKSQIEALLQVLPVGVALVDAEGANLRSNLAFEQVWGAPRPPAHNLADYAAYQAWWAESGQPVRPEEWASFQAVQKGEPVVSQVLQIQRFDGARAFVLNSAAPIRNAQGQITGSAVAILDITAMKKTEAALRESEERLRLATETANIGFYDWNTRTGETYLSKHWKKQLGYEEHEVPNRLEEFETRLHPEERERVLAHVHEYLNHPYPDYQLEFRLRHRDGSYRTILTRAELLPDSTGARCRMIGTHLDITEQKHSEEKLRRLAQFPEENPNPVMRVSLDGTLLYANTPSKGLLIPQPGSSQPLLPTALRALVAEAEQHKHVVEAEIELSDRRTFWFAALRPRGEDYTNVYARDITERRQVEEELRESELFYRQTLESIPGMLFTTRPDGYCDYQSQQWVEFTGVPMSEHLGDGWSKLLHPDDQPRALAAWRDAVEGRAPYDIEYRVRRHDGEYEWFKVRGRPIRDSTGQIVRWFGTALNIDDLVKAQAALQRSQRLYRAIGESIDYGIWVCEPDGRNTYASDSFLKLVGITQEQCSNFGWGDVLHPDDAERAIAAWKECVRTGGTWDIEHRCRGVDGQWHPILARGVPVRDDDGRLLCWAGINLDISRLKRTEEHLRALLQEKEVLLQEIHHRVKNNLQVISSLINLQADTLDQPALRSSLNDVRDRVRTMALVHEKLYQSADLTRLDFSEYAASLLQYLWRAHGVTAAHVRLTLAAQPVALPTDVAVPCGLILNELATNALKHAFQGRTDGEVNVGITHDASTNQVCLSVSDNGPGLPSSLNWRESRSLGLRLVQMLARQISGRMEVCPKPGTEFRVTFTAAQTS